MIVIHIDSMPDTNRLKRMYDGLDNVTLLYNPSREEIDNTLQTNDDPVVMCLGHGSPSGLFGTDWRGMAIDKYNAELLRNRTVIGVWCYASEFARREGLHGYFTYMFISNNGEAESLSYHGHTDSEIFEEIDVFCDSIKSFIEADTDMDCWVKILQEGCHKEKDFVRFNYSRMEYFK